MSYSFYDWNNALQQRNEYVEDRLKDGSPVVGVSYAEGVLLLSLRGSQRKIFEVYDRLMMGSLGKQSDIESLRLASIDTAHKEGFERSPDDVSIQRLVGFSLSPAIKRVYNDQSAIPLTLRTIYTELGKTPNDDHFFVIGFDGEFRTQNRFAVAAGTTYAEEQAEDDDFDPLSDTDLKIADDPAVAIREALKNGLRVEAGVLDRATAKEVKFRLLSEKEYHPWLSEV
jgi:proteasome alpha subunit